MIAQRLLEPIVKACRQVVRAHFEIVVDSVDHEGVKPDCRSEGGRQRGMAEWIDLRRIEVKQVPPSLWV